MVTDFLAWYEDRLKETTRDGQLVLTEGTRILSDPQKVFSIIQLGNFTYFQKFPHSRYYKNNRYDFAGSLEKSHKSNIDNELATSSELLAQDKYRSFNFLTANHFVLKKNKEYYLFSANVLCDYVKVQSMNNLVKSEDKNQKRFFDRSYYYNLKKIFAQKDQFLMFMTEECYDELVKYLLMSVFEFSDDENMSNISLCRNLKSDKFEKMFVYDKESTVFNPMIAKGMSYHDVNYQAVIYDRYIGKKIEFAGECFADRFSYIKNLIQKGIMPQKYVKFLKELGSYDYDKASQIVYDTHGIRVNQLQLDMYKYGTECALYVSEVQPEK